MPPPRSSLGPWRTSARSHRGLDSFSGKPRGSGPPAGTALPIEGVVLSLQDLIGYFEPPSEELQHEEKQSKLRSLRNRQSLFQEEVRAPGGPAALWAWPEGGRGFEGGACGRAGPGVSGGAGAGSP